MADWRAFLSIAGVAAVCAALLGASHAITVERIEANHAARFTAELQRLLGDAVPRLPEGQPAWVDDVWHLCNGHALLRQRARGYAGPIELLLAVDVDPPLRYRGVAVTRHQETPGIVDFLDGPQSDWLAAFRDKDLLAVSRIDAVAGATITSQAITQSLQRALQRDALTPSGCET